ncbi:MAG TPA: inactive serine/threonine-protein kinase VRK3, partial [Candidatus Eremiobacteraeota bacterium]|nr:inactive serine/threonine-protein kinase VRK3 [Candidatus Eremiobacteraeota bacterium]
MKHFCQNCQSENPIFAKFCCICGMAVEEIISPGKPLARGIILENRYEIIDLIKSYNKGAVYKASDSKLGRICVIKEFFNPYEKALRLKDLTRCFKEQSTLLSILENPSALMEYFIREDKYYLLMNFTEGNDLSNILPVESISLQELLEDLLNQSKITEYFINRAKLLSKLPHSSLPEIVDYFVFFYRQYLVMEFIEGEDLKKLMEKESKAGFSEDKVVEWSRQVLEALDYLYKEKVIYAEIKPDNIILNKDGRAILLHSDFT